MSSLPSLSPSEPESSELLLPPAFTCAHGVAAHVLGHLGHFHVPFHLCEAQPPAARHYRPIPKHGTCSLHVADCIQMITRNSSSGSSRKGGDHTCATDAAAELWPGCTAARSRCSSDRSPEQQPCHSRTSAFATCRRVWVLRL